MAEYDLSTDKTTPDNTPSNFPKQSVNTGATESNLQDSTALGFNSGNANFYNNRQENTYIDTINIDVTNMTRKWNSVAATGRASDTAVFSANEESVHQGGDVSLGEKCDKHFLREPPINMVQHISQDDDIIPEIALRKIGDILKKIKIDENGPGLKVVGDNPDKSLQVLCIDLRNVKPLCRMKTSHNIELTVKVAEFGTRDTESIYYFLEQLYKEVSGNGQSFRDGSVHQGSMVQPYISTSRFDTIEVNLTNIPSDLYQTLTRHSVDTIVFLAEYSPNKTHEINNFVNRKYIRLERLTMFQME